MAEENEKPSFTRSVMSGIGGALKGGLIVGAIGAVGGAVLGAIAGLSGLHISSKVAELLIPLVNNNAADTLASIADKSYIISGAPALAAIGAVAFGSLVAPFGATYGGITGVLQSREVEQKGSSKEQVAIQAFAQGVQVGALAQNQNVELNPAARTDNLSRLLQRNQKSLETVNQIS